MNKEDLTKVTVNLIPAAWAALCDAAQELDVSKTDTINRALQAYAWILRQESLGRKIYVYDPQDGSYGKVEGFSVTT